MPKCLIPNLEDSGNQVIALLPFDFSKSWVLILLVCI